MTELSNMGKKLGMNMIMDEHSAWTAEHVDALAKQLEAERPDGLLIVLFANHSRAMADRLSAAAERLGIPVVFYIGLGVMSRPGHQFPRLPAAGRPLHHVAGELRRDRGRPA
jgi:predicted TIM-barrel fold metal-dependent hydrolase